MSRGAVQYADDFDPALSQTVEDEIVLETGDRQVAELGQGRVIGIVAGAYAGRSGQLANGRLGGVEKPQGGAGIVLADVFRPQLQVA